MNGLLGLNLLGNDKLFGYGGGSGIKSVQRGEVTLTTTSTDITISAVDINKAIVIINVVSMNATPNLSLTAGGLVNSTTLRLTLNTTGQNPRVSWQVVEYIAVKSLQKGSVAIAAASTDIAISAVNLSKSILFYSYSSAASATASWLIRGTLTTSTNLNIDSKNSDGNVNWQVIEFS